MWIASRFGFFSIVKWPARELWQVRARIGYDLESLKKALKSNAEIIETLDSDYRFRILLTEKEIQKVFKLFGQTIDYSNFKAHIGSSPEQRHKLNAYHQIWQIMHREQIKRYPQDV